MQTQDEQIRDHTYTHKGNRYTRTCKSRPGKLPYLADNGVGMNKKQNKELNVERGSMVHPVPSQLLE